MNIGNSTNVTSNISPRKVVNRPPLKTESKTESLREQPPIKQAIMDLLSIPTIPLGTLAAIQAVRSDDPNEVSPFAMDIFAIESHKEDLADAIVELAKSYPVLAAVLEKIAVTTPFMAIVSSVMAISLQIAENHGALPREASMIPGLVVPRHELAATIRQQGERLAHQTNNDQTEPHPGFIVSP